jgi:hypothetical protein
MSNQDANVDKIILVGTSAKTYVRGTHFILYNPEMNKSFQTGLNSANCIITSTLDGRLFIARPGLPDHPHVKTVEVIEEVRVEVAPLKYPIPPMESEIPKEEALDEIFEEIKVQEPILPASEKRLEEIVTKSFEIEHPKFVVLTQRQGDFCVCGDTEGNGREDDPYPTGSQLMMRIDLAPNIFEVIAEKQYQKRESLGSYPCKWEKPEENVVKCLHSYCVMDADGRKPPDIQERDYNPYGIVDYAVPLYLPHQGSVTEAISLKKQILKETNHQFRDWKIIEANEGPYPVWKYVVGADFLSLKTHLYDGGTGLLNRDLRHEDKPLVFLHKTEEKLLDRVHGFPFNPIPCPVELRITRESVGQSGINLLMRFQRSRECVLEDENFEDSLCSDFVTEMTKADWKRRRLRKLALNLSWANDTIIHPTGGGGETTSSLQALFRRKRFKKLGSASWEENPF